MRWTTPFLLTGALTVASPNRVEACSCALSPTLCNGVATAAAVFEATVDQVDVTFEESSRRNADGSVSVTIGNMTSTVQFSNIKALRGTPPDQLVRRGVSTCDFEFKAGVRYLIVAERTAAGGLEVGKCGVTRPMDEAMGLLEYVTSLDRPNAETLVWGRAVHAGDRRQSPVVFTPLPKIEVTLHGPTTATTTTDERGYFMVRGLPLGAYGASSRNPVPGGPAPISYSAQFDLSRDVPLGCAELLFWIER